MLFPLITFPYASRMLLADGIGQMQFFTSIINYVVLLTSLGIPMYGIREIAKVRDDAKELSKTTTEIILLNLLLNVFGYIIIFVMCLTVSKVQYNIPLFILLSSSIVLTTLGCPWFYKGIEDFKYVTIRGICVRSISVVLLFVLVHGPEDLLWYGFYSVVGSIGNNLLNFARLRKYVSLKAFTISELDIKRHVKPAFEIFVFNLVTSIYLNLDTVMVGFIKNTAAVGFYTAASKLSHLLLSLVVSLGTVLLPRSSNLIQHGQMEEFAKLAKKSYNFVLLIAFPLCFGLIVLSPTLIRLFSGDDFLPAIRTLQIISPIIIMIGISNLIGLQVLYPLNKIKIVTISTCVGAAVNFTLNCILIPLWSQDGAAVATVAAEISVTVTQVVIARKLIPFSLFDRKGLIYIVSSLIMFIACNTIMKIGLTDYQNIIIVPAVGVLVYGTLMIVSKDDLSLEMLNVIKKKIYKNDKV